ncbi:hypothetical protein [Pseudomonas indica]|uniref:hypothetical protein n=1 Tax=Pseudomonas indica TaxID=137658 RepID=UPI000BAB5928|nr:hypothetical protein [Pseudomonas indica]PAU60069.1 hypothetical protein BZL42_10875 [Pseudomonas indica]
MIPHADCMRWAQWWATGWTGADESWGVEACFAPWERSMIEYAAPLHHGAFARRLGLSQDLPSHPDPVVLRLIDETVEARLHALLLVAEIFGKGRVVDLPDAEAQWCRRIARALLPGSWVPPEWAGDEPRVAGLRSLYGRLDAACWKRARLLFPRPLVEQVESCEPAPLPAAKLAALWDAVIWKNRCLWERGAQAC